MISGSAVAQRNAFRTDIPPWARRAAALAALTTLPSGLWRLPLAFGYSMGLGPDVSQTLGAPGWGSAYIVALSVLAEGLAFLTLGLVRPWGERWPRWVPFAGGRPIAVRSAVVPAVLGGFAITALAVAYLAAAILGNGPGEGSHGPALWLMYACYAPLIAWGPLLLAVTLHYYRRRTGGADLSRPDPVR
ncbi:hypothetical protein [Actinomadura atramentaria]|uniref:hypothetical protein n=1 Tax=Actinomadura atramentaria TaxID=1990 RepID=UPI000399DE33|nr:hypothetical protein [Actinomadura atramentaria]